ncbi:transcription factor HES-5-like [Myripristis murdjan]|uniref:Transcription factor HES-5-like n=1 Tax=Myripristis murdjan TaxID=586833 RepID=A0A667WU04_9TELE|nr:transcription factor HES-5-like [Myripristis murdjan]
MAPTITSAASNCQEQLTLSHKLRKPLVEKHRRERINSSIEQLKCLLAPELLQQQPDSKLEKADILEMTVCFLRRQQRRRQQQQRAVDSAAVNQGYSSCVQEVAHFLSKEELKSQSQRRLLKHFHKLQSSSDKKLSEAGCSLVSCPVQSSSSKEERPVNSALWRPWDTAAGCSSHQTN